MKECLLILNDDLSAVVGRLMVLTLAIAPSVRSGPTTTFRTFSGLSRVCLLQLFGELVSGCLSVLAVKPCSYHIVADNLGYQVVQSVLLFGCGVLVAGTRNSTTS